MAAPYAPGYPYQGYTPYPQQGPQYPPQPPQQYPPQHQQSYGYQGPTQYPQPYPQAYNAQYQQPFHQQPPPPQPQAQQYGPQASAYQQPYVPHAQGQVTQVPFGRDPHGCYNCGHPDHFAQNCPEPKRANPVGDIHRSAFYAHKRLKTDRGPGGPFGPGAQAGYGPPAQIAPQGQYAHSDYPSNQYHYPGPNPPATPMSDTSNSGGAGHYGHHPPPHAPYQQYPLHSPPPNSGYPPQQGHPQQGPQNSMARPTPSQEYGLSQADRRSSYGSKYQLSQGSPNQLRASSISSPSPVADSLNPARDQLEGTYSPPIANHPERPQSAVSLLPEGPVELEDDEIKALDIPDFPTIAGATPAVPVANPLPSNFVVADALAPYQPPGPESDGLVMSKYLSLLTSIDRNFRDTDAWEESFTKDPAFTELADAPVKLGPLKWNDTRRSSEHEHRPAFDRTKSSQSGDQSFRKNGRSPSFGKYHAQRRDRETWSRDRSKSPSKFDRSVSRRRSRNFREHSFHWNDHPRNHEMSPNQTSPTDIHRHSIDAKPASPHSQPPPPPPPPIRDVKWPHGQNEGPADTNTGIPNWSGAENGQANGNSHRHESGEESVVSPSKGRIERSQGRKREPSEESDTPRRRQADDFIPRHKRRQPKVAEAYR